MGTFNEGIYSNNRVHYIISNHPIHYRRIVLLYIKTIGVYIMVRMDKQLKDMFGNRKNLLRWLGMHEYKYFEYFLLRYKKNPFIGVKR